LNSYYENELKLLQANSESPDKIIKIGEYKHEPVADKASLAALIEVVMTIYNMEEAIVRS
jgi:hypothetical protein